jgi:hypothetical protein
MPRSAPWPGAVASPGILPPPDPGCLAGP